MPCHHNLEEYLSEYIAAAGLADSPKSPLFRIGQGQDRNSHRESDAPGRRLPDDSTAALGGRNRGADRLSFFPRHRHHLLHERGGKLETPQEMAGYASARTKSLYNRVDDEISLDEIERIMT